MLGFALLACLLSGLLAAIAPAARASAVSLRALIGTDRTTVRGGRNLPGAALVGAEVALKSFRKDIIIEMYNEAGQVVLAYRVYRCWVSEYQAVPDLDANANAVAIQHIKLEHEGFERDVEVAEPSEPSFTGA